MVQSLMRESLYHKIWVEEEFLAIKRKRKDAIVVHL